MADFLTFLYIGVILLFVGMTLLALRNLKNLKKAEGGAIIMIGPIPVVIASNPRIARILIIVGIAIFVLFVILLLVG